MGCGVYGAEGTMVRPLRSESEEQRRGGANGVSQHEDFGVSDTGGPDRRQYSGAQFVRRAHDGPQMFCVAAPPAEPRADRGREVIAVGGGGARS